VAAEPFEVSITEAEIADLRERLRRTRWPEAEPVDDWSQGLPLAYAQELCRTWAEDYDFGFAKRLNVFPQYRDTVDGLGIHFVHVRSPEADAFPLVLTHGWPGSVLEFLEVLGPLTDPRAHGADPADAFHVVAPSLPGYGWSDKPSTTGWGITRIARAWDTLMVSLGYGGYAAQQATRPQTLGYGLTDSPAGQAAWIAEKFWAWTDNDGHPEDAVSRQTILDEISVYWFTASATSSARLYWESFGSFRDEVTAPSGLSIYPRDIARPSRREAERRFTDLRWFEELPRGGHFAALEQPESLVEQVRGFFRLFR